MLRIAPPGMQPPNIIQFNASNVPVVQVTLNSKTLPEQLLSDYANQFLRLRLFTIPGLSIPGAFGGKQRQIIVEVDTAKASSKGLSQMDVVNAMGTTNVIVPAGIARLGPKEYNIQLNSSPQRRRAVQLPAGRRPRRHSGAARRRRQGQRQLRAADQHRAHQRPARELPADPQELAPPRRWRWWTPSRTCCRSIQAIAPDGMELGIDFDQSVFVRAAVENVVKEAVLASILVSLMILVFLGSWRNTVVVAISIPLSIFAGVVGLYMTGQTINLMTLGGLALAIGMLVDNATVVMENIHRNQTLGKPVTVAILDGSVEVIQPLTVATLCICIVFFPVVFLDGPARFLFIPLAITVVLAMLASYVLSFTVVPALARQLLKDEHHHAEGERLGWGRRLANAFDRGFDRVRNAYGGAAGGRPGPQEVRAGLLRASSSRSPAALVPVVGTDFFPHGRRRHPQAARARAARAIGSRAPSRS